MALQATLPPEQNQLGTGPLAVYCRTGQVANDWIQQTLVISILGFADQAAYDAGKKALANFQPVAFLPEAQPIQRDPLTDDVIRPAIPSFQELVALFAPEFEFMNVLAYELARRFDPSLQGAEYTDPQPDPAILADIQSRLDAAGYVTPSKE